MDREYPGYHRELKPSAEMMIALEAAMELTDEEGETVTLEDLNRKCNLILKTLRKWIESFHIVYKDKIDLTIIDLSYLSLQYISPRSSKVFP